MKSHRVITQVQRGLVDRGKPYFLLRLVSSSLDLISSPRALVGFPDGGIVKVEFLLADDKPANKEAVNAIWRDVQFYLIELSALDPWLYAQYHCSTCANVYGDVHWSYVPRATVKSSKLIDTISFGKFPKN